MKVIIKDLGEVHGSRKFFAQLSYLLYCQAEALREEGFTGAAQLYDEYLSIVRQARDVAHEKGESNRDVYSVDL